MKPYKFKRSKRAQKRLDALFKKLMALATKMDEVRAKINQIQ